MKKASLVTTPPGTGVMCATTSDALAKSPPTVSLRSRDLPLRLFEEVVRSVGIGEERRIMTRSTTYAVRLLNPAHKFTGFDGAIGFHRDDYRCVCAFWSWIPRPDTRDDEDDYPVLTFSGQMSSGGRWVVDRNNLLVETLRIGFSRERFDLPDPSMTFVGLLIARCNQLASDPDVIKERYWEGDIEARAKTRRKKR